MQSDRRQRVEAGPLVAILLAGTSAQLLVASRGLLHAFALKGERGRFSKEQEESRAFGRRLCDGVKREFNCGGFFTTDELPRYGLTADDRNRVFQLYRDADPGRDVLVLCTYPKKLASDIMAYVLERMDDDVTGS